MNPPDRFKDGQSLRDYSAKDLLPFSAKLLPEFDKRRSIKDMFKKQTSAPSVETESGTPSLIDHPSLLPAGKPTTSSITAGVNVFSSPKATQPSGQVSIPSPKTST